MNCPKCGFPIYQGDIACRNCHLPIAQMSGISPTITPHQKEQIIQEVQTIQTPYIEPTRMEPSYIPKESMPIPPISEPVNHSNDQFKNYGEGQKAITSIRFLLPILLGVIALGIVSFGIITFISTIVEDKKARYDQEQVINYQIEFNNFLYTIPTEYTYKKESSTNTLYISDEENSFEMAIQVMDATYSSVRSRKASLKSYFQSIGYTVGDVIEQTYANTSYLVLEASKSKKNYILAVTKAGDSSKAFGVSIKTSSNVFDYTILETVSSILTTAEYQKESSSNSQNVDFDFSDIVK